MFIIYHTSAIQKKNFAANGTNYPKNWFSSNLTFSGEKLSLSTSQTSNMLRIVKTTAVSVGQVAGDHH